MRQSPNRAGGRAVLVLQARMGSTRLSGKSLMDLAGAPLVARILERVVRCASLDQIVLATPDCRGDDALADLAAKFGVTSFRGSENDLVDRYYQAAKAAGADIVLRLPADNPVPEPAEIDRILAFHRQNAFDFTSNLAQVLGNGYPDGIGAEVFDFVALEDFWRDQTDPFKREHVHLSFFDYGKQQPVGDTKVGTLPCPAEFRRPDLVLDVNTEPQYRYIRALYEALYPQKPDFHITDIIAWHDRVWSQRDQAQ